MRVLNRNRVLNVLIASPEDMVIERKIVREVCLGLNNSALLNHLGISFQIAVWEDIFLSEEGLQRIVDRLVNECDIFVCLFHKRCSTTSCERESNSFKEFLSAYDSWGSSAKPHCMFYFKEESVSTMKELKDNQSDSMINLEEKIKNEKLLYCDDFSAPYEFCEKIYDHLENWVSENIKLR